MNTEIETAEVFATPLWMSRLPLFETHKDNLINLCNEIRENDPKGVVYSNENGYQSVSFAGDNRFIPLFEKIAEMVRTAINDCKFIESEIIIDHCWVNYNEAPNAMNVEHVHGGVFSGVFYLHVPPESGELYLRNPGLNPMWKGSMMPREKANKLTKLFEIMTPVEGNIYLWASHVPHFVVPNRHNDGRISISFNVDLKPI
jgi:uncharacterized protein (TIGR02466 family)